MITILWAQYIIQEGALVKPKKVITCYFSPVCPPCFELKKTKLWQELQKDKDTLIVYQPLIMDDHKIPLQIFILSLIKKFRLTQFWDMCDRFYKLEQDPRLTAEDIAKDMGFSKEEIEFAQNHKSYQKEVEKNLRNPVKALLKRNKVVYKTIKDSEIDVLPVYICFKTCSNR